MGVDRWRYIVGLRLRSLLRSHAVECELDEEIRDHLDRRTADLIEQGYAPDEARLLAIRAFGGVEQRKEECRDARGVRLLEDLGKDLRYALRMAGRQPAFTSAAVLSLALGIGASTAIFSLFDTLLLKPLPVRGPDSLRVLTQHTMLGGRVAKSNNMFPIEWFRSLQPDSGVFADVIAFADLTEAVVTDAGRDRPSRGGGVLVSANYFHMLGVTAAHGRVWAPHDASPSIGAPVVLSHAFWTRQFGGDPAVVDREVFINAIPATIVGVTPPEFFGLALGRVPDFFLPLDAVRAVASGDARGTASRPVHVVARLERGVTDDLATERLTTFTVAQQPAVSNGPERVIRALPLDTGLSDVRDRFGRPLVAAMAMVGLLLLIACANVATMLMSRATGRKTEILIRSTMGAGRARLLRQFFAEALLLTAIAGGAGVVFATWGTRTLTTMLPFGVTTVASEVGLDWRVLGFTVAVCMAAAVCFGLAPALHTARIDLAASLRDRWQSGGNRRLTGPFVVVQVALAMTLVVTAVLLARTLMGLSTFDAGFLREQVVVANMNPGAHGYRDAQLTGYYRELSERVMRGPHVRSATLVHMPLMSSARTTGTATVPGFTPTSEDERWVQVFQVGARYFETLQTSIVRGRDFSDADIAAGARVAAISQGAAQRYFGADDPIGRSIASDGEYRVVAVVSDGRYNNLRDEPTPTLFVPYTSMRPRASMVLVARVDGDVRAAMGGLHTQIRQLDAGVPVEITPLSVVVDRSLSLERLLAALATFFAATALVLLVIGLYGVMAYWVADRVPEIGVRLALGARPNQVRWTVLRQPLTLACIGIAAGLGLTLATTRVSGSLLFGLSPTDPLTLMMSAAIVLAVALAAGLVPARRAMRVNPAITLRAN